MFKPIVGRPWIKLIEPNAVKVDCRECKRPFEVQVEERAVWEWLKGELIQRAMPRLSLDDRELLISGTCGSCWDEMFK